MTTSIGVQVLAAWVWSDDPADWASQLGAVFTIVTAVFTGAYVVLTHRLIRWTARTAQLGIDDVVRRRLVSLQTVRPTIARLVAAVGSLRSSDREGIVGAAGVLEGGSVELHELLAAQPQVSTFVRERLEGCLMPVEDLAGRVGELVGKHGEIESDVGMMEDAIRTSEQELGRALMAIDAEVAFWRSGIAPLPASHES